MGLRKPSVIVSTKTPCATTLETSNLFTDHAVARCAGPLCILSTFSDLLRSAINAADGAEDICPPRHVQLQALLKRAARQKTRPDDATAATADGHGQ